MYTSTDGSIIWGVIGITSVRNSIFLAIISILFFIWQLLVQRIQELEFLVRSLYAFHVTLIHMRCIVAGFMQSSGENRNRG